MEHSAEAAISPRTWRRVGAAMFTVGFGANLFAPMLEVYREQDGLSESFVTGMLGIYAAGLVPALLVFGPVSDHRGRRAVMRPALAVVFAASLILAAASQTSDWLLYLGRWIMGFGVGMAMSSGSAWVKQLSTDRPGAGPRRATVVLSAGFGAGPLAAGLLAQFLPAPQVTPFVVHLVLVLAGAALVWRVPETQPVARGARPRQPLVPPVALTGRFFWVIAAWAPWVFGTATVAFASIPLFTLSSVRFPIAYLGLVASVVMFTGVFVQPLAARLGEGGWLPLSVTGLGAASAGLVLGAFTVAWHLSWLAIPTGVLLGVSYGFMMVAGLREVELMARPHELGALIGVFYTLTYVGFAVPFVLSFLAPAVARVAGVGETTGFVWCLLAGSAGSAVPVARAAARALPGPGTEG
ncbi:MULTISPECIES: MFS transporter [unclassified Kocuria]|uniref:MFS transporter n=1 Tax=unclassified Kocuria TaxID=2649579 RepID=UPI000F8735D2|nr:MULTISPECIES: MFS transporter [unclassified Kocuria]RUP84416.1 MFS transporter [Kocuria sp. HSID17590]RUQ11837.1 MFS transporter [Kocuria sp. HSID17582]